MRREVGSGRSGMGKNQMNSVRKKTMRVATLFTGAAACAVAGTTAAHAQDTPQPAGHSAKAVGLAVHPDGVTISGSIREAACTTGRDTWLHVVSEDGGLYCYGFAGTYSPTSEIGVYTQCGGNNYGSLYVNESKLIPFGPGTTYRKLNYAHLTDVLISFWSGTDKC